MMPDDYFTEVANKNASGELTVGFAQFGYLRLGPEHKYRVVIKTNAKIDGKPILFFADSLTWAFRSEYADCKCKMVQPTGFYPYVENENED